MKKRRSWKKKRRNYFRLDMVFRHYELARVHYCTL
jgi:hypothetical protein